MLNQSGTQPIKTERLLLRRFTLDDIQDAHEKWAGCIDSDFWQQPNKSIEETKQMVGEYVKRYDKADWYMWAIDLDDELIGLICGTDINVAYRSICIGYCITESHRNRGLATEACKALIQYLFSIGFYRVSAQHNPINPASGKVMEKCGMLYEGLIRGGSMYRGEICDCLQYAVLKSD